MEEFGRKIVAHLNSYSGLQNIRKEMVFEGTKPKTGETVRITVQDHGIGILGRYEIFAYTIGGEANQHDRVSGDTLDEAIRQVHWGWL